MIVGDYMKNGTKVLLCMTALGGVGLMLYKKYNPDMMKDIEKSFNKVKKEVTNNLENMM